MSSAPPAEFMFAVAEAFDWLAAQGLIAQSPSNLGGFSGESFFRTRLGEATLEAHQPLEHVRAVQQLVVGLHPRIEARVRRQFLLGEDETAVFVSLREVEIRVRELSGAGEDDYGISLMRSAFKPNPPGPLADKAQPPAERQATMELFSGAYGVFRNPSGHREVEYGAPAMVPRIVLLADLLLHTLDRIEARIAAEPPGRTGHRAPRVTLLVEARPRRIAEPRAVPTAKRQGSRPGPALRLPPRRPMLLKSPPARRGRRLTRPLGPSREPMPAATNSKRRVSRRCLARPQVGLDEPDERRLAPCAAALTAHVHGSSTGVLVDGR